MMQTDIHPDLALELVLEQARSSRTDTMIVPVEKAAGKCLAVPAHSLVDQPPFAKSAMDGFAYNLLGRDAAAGDLPQFRISETVRAGFSREAPLEAGEAVPIMTGAPIPAGADAVQRVEWTRREADKVVFTKRESINNIIAKGENCKAGDRVLSPRILSPQDAGILAASGYRYITVYRPLKVAVLSTGDELLEPSCTLPLEAIGPETRAKATTEASKLLGTSSIFDSNGFQLTSQAASCGAEVSYLGIFRDDIKTLTAAIGKALDETDIVILSGGVSKGSFDFIPQVAHALGIDGVFHGLLMKPGKPTFFGTKDGKALFGLPGNPVSTFVNFEVFIKPYLYACAGIVYNPLVLACVLAKDVRRRETSRVEHIPAKIDFPDAVIAPLVYHGSSMITALGDANALLRLEIGVDTLQKGSTVYARLIRPIH